MKCEKCNNEATFHFQSNVNGEKTEYHLCAECAKEAGFDKMLDFRPRTMLDSFWREPFGGLMSGFFDEPFGSLERSFLAPIMTMPQIKVIVGNPEKGEDVKQVADAEEKAKNNIPKDAGDEIREKRELFALKHQLRTAIRNEEFEKAAELRDKIHELEEK